MWFSSDCVLSVLDPCSLTPLCTLSSRPLSMSETLSLTSPISVVTSSSFSFICIITSSNRSLDVFSPALSAATRGQCLPVGEG